MSGRPAKTKMPVVASRLRQYLSLLCGSYEAFYRQFRSHGAVSSSTYNEWVRRITKPPAANWESFRFAVTKAFELSEKLKGGRTLEDLNALLNQFGDYLFFDNYVSLAKMEILPAELDPKSIRIPRPDVIKQFLDWWDSPSHAVVVHGAPGLGKAHGVYKALHQIPPEHRPDKIIWAPSAVLLLDTSSLALAEAFSFLGLRNIIGDKNFRVRNLANQAQGNILLVFPDIDLHSELGAAIFSDLYSSFIHLANNGLSLRVAYLSSMVPVPLLGSCYDIPVAPLDDNAARLYAANVSMALDFSEGSIQPSEIDEVCRTAGNNPNAIEEYLRNIKKASFEGWRRAIANSDRSNTLWHTDAMRSLYHRCSEDQKNILMGLKLNPGGATYERLMVIIPAFSDRAFESLPAAFMPCVYRVDDKPVYYALQQWQMAAIVEESKLFAVLRERLISEIWRIATACHIDNAWNNSEAFAIYDLERERWNASACIDWLYEEKRYKEVVDMVEGYGYYFYVQGMWHELMSLAQLRVDASKAMGCQRALFNARTFIVNVDSKARIDSFYEAVDQNCESLLLENDAVHATLVDLGVDERFDWVHAQALYKLSVGQPSAACELYERMPWSEKITPRRRATYLKWYARALAHSERAEECEQALQSLDVHSRKYSSPRGCLAAAVEQAHQEWKKDRLTDASKLLGGAEWAYLACGDDMLRKRYEGLVRKVRGSDQC